ncbi:hypothetical protein LINPERHAP1_LOCUS31003, partial [Linum perenne]
YFGRRLSSSLFYLLLFQSPEKHHKNEEKPKYSPSSLVTAVDLGVPPPSTRCTVVWSRWHCCLLSLPSPLLLRSAIVHCRSRSPSPLPMALRCCHRTVSGGASISDLPPLQSAP